MKYLSRPYRKRPYYRLGLLALLGIGAGAAITPPAATAQMTQLAQLLQDPSPVLLVSSGSQGYLGVDVTDVDLEKAQALKLKEVRGAVITLIDHDAPAGQIGLKVNDVIIQLNGQNVEGAEQLRRMLREIPAGRKVSIEISRDGNVQTLAVELADRRVMEHEIWSKIGSGGDVFAQGSGPAQGPGILYGDGTLPGMFRLPIFGSTLNVGAIVEPLTSQMAEYLGVPSGLMVKQVARKSEAAVAGLKAFDVILKVGPDTITNLSAWDRALRSNQGKPVQVTILRDKKQQTLTLQVDSKHKQGELNEEEIFPADDCPVVAAIDPEMAQNLGWDGAAAAEALGGRAQALRDRIAAGGLVTPQISQQQADALRRQAEKLRDSFKPEDFKFDEKQFDQLKQQMEEFRRNFRPEDFKIDPKQMEELRRQMEELRKTLPEQFNLDQDQLDRLKRQMEEMTALGFGDHA